MAWTPQRQRHGLAKHKFSKYEDSLLEIMVQYFFREIYGLFRN